jgi:DNA-binding NarL/FixJ family response regulator
VVVDFIVKEATMPEKELITVAIIDHDKDFLENCLALLRKEKDIEVCASHLLTNILKESAAASEAGKDIYRCQPKVFLICQKILREVAAVDLKTIFKMRDAFPQIRTVVTVEHYTEEAAMILIHEGVRGLYIRELGPSQIVSCVRTVAKGNVWLDAHLIGRVVEEFSRLYKHVDSLRPPTKNHEAKLSLLSHREMEILELVSKSYTNVDIGHKLFISEKTVKTHIKNIFEKLGVRNRVEAMLVLIRSGLAGQ